MAQGDIPGRGVQGGGWSILTRGLVADPPQAQVVETVEEPEEIASESHWARAIAFPFLVLPGGDVALAEDERAVSQNMEVTLMTDLGDWYKQPAAGSRVSSIVFDPNDEVSRELIDLHLREALQTSEPRADFLRTNVRGVDERIEVLVPYRLRATGQVRSAKVGVPASGA